MANETHAAYFTLVPTKQAHGVTRRRFLQGLGAFVGATTLSVGYARFGEPNWVQVDEIVLPIPGLPAHLTGMRIAQLSDIHLGAYFTAAQLQEAIAHVNRLNVNLLMLTGDFVTSREHNRAARSAAHDKIATELVEPLRAAQIPTYASLGNHDLWGGVEAVTRNLAAAGVTLLRNEGVQVADDLWLAAVDDVWSGRPDIHAALRDAPAGSINLLMAHEPDYFDTVLDSGAPVAAQFSGHSHGGQVRLPLLVPGADGLFTTAPILPTYGERYPIGLRQINQRYVYTNRGLGCWPVPFRINCPPEISVFVLEEAG